MYHNLFLIVTMVVHVLMLFCWTGSLVSGASGQTVDISPKEALRRIGDMLTILCKVDYPLDACRMTIGTITYRLKPGANIDNIEYSGQGLEKGECGVKLKSIQEDWKGNISCVLPPRTGNVEVMATMRLIVGIPPPPPKLTLNQATFKEGDILLATCEVGDGRPVASITWFLGNQQVTEGVQKPLITDKPDDIHTISQNFTRVVRSDDAAILSCKAENPVTDRPAEAQIPLIVYYAPKSDSNVITFVRKMGGEGRLYVKVRSNPGPRAMWTVGDVNLTAPQTTADGHITAQPPEYLGSGYYNVSLLLSSTTKEDLSRTYALRVSNDLGALNFSILDKPDGLGSGAIAGIVVGLGAVIAALVYGLVTYVKSR